MAMRKSHISQWGASSEPGRPHASQALVMHPFGKCAISGRSWVLAILLVIFVSCHLIRNVLCISYVYWWRSTDCVHEVYLHLVIPKSTISSNSFISGRLCVYMSTCPFEATNQGKCMSRLCVFLKMFLLHIYSDEPELIQLRVSQPHHSPLPPTNSYSYRRD